eukprot:jgi/Bigna1/66197/fgenesh1_pg.1_\
MGDSRANSQYEKSQGGHSSFHFTLRSFRRSPPIARGGESSSLASTVLCPSYMDQTFLAKRPSCLDCDPYARMRSIENGNENATFPLFRRIIILFTIFVGWRLTRKLGRGGARASLRDLRLYQDCASGDQSLQGDSVARLIISDSDSTIVMHKIASGISEAPVVPRRISHVSYGSSPKTLRRVKN